MSDSLIGARLITRERMRQVSEEGYTRGHDQEYQGEELVQAAICYATPWYIRRTSFWVQVFREGKYVPHTWPWGAKYWKPSQRRGPDDNGHWPNNSIDGRVRELTKAGALIAAEIDRLLSMKQEES